MGIGELGRKLASGGVCAIAHKSVGLATCDVSDTRDAPPGTPEREKVLEDVLLCPSYLLLVCCL